MLLHWPALSHHNHAGEYQERYESQVSPIVQCLFELDSRERFLLHVQALLQIIIGSVESHARHLEPLILTNIHNVGLRCHAVEQEQ